MAKDEVRAVALYKKASRRRRHALLRQPRLDERDGPRRPRQGDRAAADLYRRGCDGGDAIGCNNLGVMAEMGRGGVASDERRAAALYEGACEGGSNNACSSFGWFLFQGRVVTQDKARGVALLRKGCAGGNTWGCDRLRETGNKP